MRGRLTLLSLATTLLVVVSFVLPLALLVRRQAADAAKVSAESDAQSVASLAALALAFNDDPAAIAATVGEVPDGTIVLLDGEPILGRPHEGQGTLAAEANETRATVAGEVPGGWEVALPVIGSSDVVVVDSFVTDEALFDGVPTAWILLAALASLLVGIAVWVADRLGQSLTRPVEDLARSARELAAGNLETRVAPQDPVELRQMGEAFNHLADRLDQLLAAERESAADLSHRLRTPLTSLRLQAEGLGDPAERAAIMEQADRLEHATSQVIELARAPRQAVVGECDLDDVVRKRAAFWSVLAEEQGRELSVELTSSGKAALAEDQIEVLVDTLIGNVFAHTPPGTGFEIRTGSDRGTSWLEVADEGPGFGNKDQPVRGRSGAGSTGLGLDIVVKIAETVGGDLEIDDRPGGGAVVRVILG